MFLLFNGLLKGPEFFGNDIFMGNFSNTHLHNNILQHLFGS
jgi:hypothetical protein